MDEVSRWIWVLRSKMTWDHLEAIRNLVAIGEPSVIPLIEILRDKYGDDPVRALSAGALGEIKDARAVSALVDALQDENNSVRSNSFRALVNIGEPVMPALIATLKSEVRELRSKAAKILGLVADHQAVSSQTVVPNLIEALKDREAGVRTNVAWALGKYRDTFAVPSLIFILKDNNKDVCRQAILALGQIGDSLAVEPIIEILKDKKQDSEVRICAAEALGNFKDERAIKSLIKALYDFNASVSYTAEKSLEGFNDEHIKRLLQEYNRPSWIDGFFKRFFS